MLSYPSTPRTERINIILKPRYAYIQMGIICCARSNYVFQASGIHSISFWWLIEYGNWIALDSLETVEYLRRLTSSINTITLFIALYENDGGLLDEKEKGLAEKSEPDTAYSTTDIFLFPLELQVVFDPQCFRKWRGSRLGPPKGKSLGYFKWKGWWRVFFKKYKTGIFKICINFTLFKQ